jgi:hypothetical protein
MLWKSAIQGLSVGHIAHHPLDEIDCMQVVCNMTHCLNNTYHWIEQVDAMVDLFPGTFLQYRHLKLKKLQSTLTVENKETEENESRVVAQIDKSNINQFLDTYETLPNEIIISAYFDAIKVLPEDKDPELSFFGCTEQVAVSDLTNGSDWLRLGKLCANESEVDCVFESRQDILERDDNKGDPWLLQVNAAPTLQGCRAMTIDTVFQGPSAFMAVVGNSSFPIIFNTGASLAISGNCNNFVGEITPIQNDL